MNTMVLVGDDTDLLVLLRYHASERGCDLYFRPEPKVNVRGACIWHMKKVKEQLGKKFTEISFFFMSSPDATQRRASMELARQQP